MGKAIPLTGRRVVDPAVIQAVRSGYCERCGREAVGEPHHIRPRSLGGPDIRENLIQLCFECHRAVHDGRINRHELVPLVAKREQLKISRVYEAIGIPEPHEERESTLDERIGAYLEGIRRVREEIYAEQSVEELVSKLVALNESEEETRWLQGEIIKVLVSRGVKKSWIAAQIGKSVTYVNNLLLTYEAFPDEEMREPLLSWTHHRIAALKSGDPRKWVARAAEEQMSTRELERAIMLEERGEERVVEKAEEEEMKRARKVLDDVQAVMERGGSAAVWLREELKKLLCS